MFIFFSVKKFVGVNYRYGENLSFGVSWGMGCDL